MATSVSSAFSIFNTDEVNLIPDRTKIGRSSRDWLIGQIEALPNKEDYFPELYDNMHIRYGSFARNTKLRPLDDIDLIITFKAQHSTHKIIEYGKNYVISVPENATKLRKLCNDDGSLNSIKVINMLVKALSGISHYKSAAIHRKQVAATLQLSYEWVFDIVPAMYTDTGYYLIPNGSGGWQATDPRIDQKRVKDTNSLHNGNALQLIRTLKYWNKRAQMPTISSYLFENIVINFLNSRSPISSFSVSDLHAFWRYLQTDIYNSVRDPKEFQGELNTLSYEDKNKISAKAKDTGDKAYDAIINLGSDPKKAIAKWTEIFGGDFPKYG